jgi:putative intracellular protease/amidase
MNTMFLANNGNGIPISSPNRPAGTQVNFSTYQAILTNGGTPTQLVDALNQRLMHGTMSAATKANIVAAVTAVTNATPATQAMQRTQTAIYLIATSSQYQVER